MIVADSPIGQHAPVVTHPGPWGTLSCLPLVIAPPLELIGPSGGTARPWHFWNCDRPALVQFFENCDLTPAQRRHLLDHTTEAAEINGLIVDAGEALLRELSTPARTKIYGWLGQSDLNPWQSDAFRFRCDSVEAWLGDLGLSQRTLDLVRRFAYQIGSYLFLGDLPLVLPEVDSLRERDRLMKGLARESAFLISVRIDQAANLEEMISYWGRGRRSKDLRPLIESLASQPNGHWLDVVHLLPPFPRQHLFTFPRPTGRPADLSHDCHWTSLNFFNPVPDERLCDVAFVRQTLESEYVRIFHDISFGDVTVFCTTQGEVYHSAVYIADGMLFTKNGPSTARPWLILPLADVQQFYPRRTATEIRYYRHRSLL